ncbi:MAG: hypothetical protein ACR2OE_01995 [Thermomicrobiales bacterium]
MSNAGNAISMARREIRRGRFQRSAALITGFAAVVSGFEAYIQHDRGAFDDKWMWTPVALTPPITAIAVAAVFSEQIAHKALPILSAVTILDGAIGFGLHLRGIKRMPGGFGLGQYNIVMGPPVAAPLLMCTVGTTGILASFLRRETLHPPGINDALIALTDLTSTSASSRIASGEFQRPLAVVTAFFAVIAGGEAYFEHMRGSFNQRVMWTPVWLTPPMAAAAIAAVTSERAAHNVLPIASLVTLGDGVLGFLLHIRGIRDMPGGVHNLRFNITMGPPLFAPLLLSSVGLLGLVASLVRRKERS